MNADSAQGVWQLIASDFSSPLRSDKNYEGINFSTTMRIALVHSICVKHDAISNSIVTECHHLLEHFGPASVKFFGYALDHLELNHKLVQNSAQVLNDDYFSSADLIIYHYGIVYDLFDTILVGNGRAKRLVCYHNVTPKHLVGSDHHEVIDKSIRQQYNLFFADHIYSVSPFDNDCLTALLLPKDRRSILNFPVDLSARKSRSSARSQIVNLIFIGRIVASKGVKDLLLALAKCIDAGRDNFFLKIIGNLGFSDQKYIAELRILLEANEELARRVQLVGEVDDPKKWQLLSSSDVFVLPTYHEGFCVPIVEALAAGCFVVSYDNSNVPNVTGDLGILVATGDIQALANAVAEICDEWARSYSEDREQVFRTRTQTWSASDFYSAAIIWAEQFSSNNRRDRFLNLIGKFLPCA